MRSARRTAPPWVGAGLWALLSQIAWAAPAPPSDLVHDLLPQGEDWDGLSAFTGGLRGAGVKLLIPQPLDLGALKPGAGVAIVGAEISRAAAAALRHFVQAGGRLLVADELGGADPLLEGLGVRRVDPPPNAQRIGGHPALLLVEGPNRGLLRGVSRLVTNHPAALTSSEGLEPALRFAGTSAAFGYHLKLGEGEVVLIADSSLLINQMQGAADNRRLAANLGAWLADEGRRPIYLVTATTGPMVGDLSSWGGGQGAPTASERINRALSRLSVPAPDDLSIRFFIALLLTAAVLYTLTVFPGGRGTSIHRGPPRSAALSVERLAGGPGGPAGPSHPRSPPREGEERESMQG